LKKIRPLFGVMQISLVLAVGLACLLASCSNHLFCDCKSLPGGYTLERSEDGVTFYLNAPRGPSDGGGAIDGTVEEIGWSDELIAAKRHANFRGDGDGWMLIDVHTQAIRGPMADSEFTKLAKQLNLRALPIDQAWLRF